jgi:hypothetical protein
MQSPQKKKKKEDIKLALATPLRLITQRHVTLLSTQ